MLLEPFILKDWTETHHKEINDFTKREVTATDLESIAGLARIYNHHLPYAIALKVHLDSRMLMLKIHRLQIKALVGRWYDFGPKTIREICLVLQGNHLAQTPAQLGDYGNLQSPNPQERERENQRIRFLTHLYLAESPRTGVNVVNYIATNPEEITLRGKGEYPVISQEIVLLGSQRYQNYAARIFL